MTARVFDHAGNSEPAFLQFWERFWLDDESPRFDDIIDPDDDMPTRHAKAQDYSQRALRRYAANRYTAQQIRDELFMAGEKPRKFIDLNLGLAFSKPCEDLDELIKYAATIREHKWISHEVFPELEKYTPVDYLAILSCLKPESWGEFKAISGLTVANYFAKVFEADDVSAATLFLKHTEINRRFDLDLLLSKHPCDMNSNLRKWHNPNGLMGANEFWERFSSQMYGFHDAEMTDDQGMCEWLSAKDEGLDDLPGFSENVQALATPIATKLFDALTGIDAALPAHMHRVHDCLVHEVAKHVDLREHYLTHIGKSPGWILMAKSLPDYDLFFLRTLLTEDMSIDDDHPRYAAGSKAARSTLWHYGYGKVEKMLRNESALLLAAYKLTQHAPLITSMGEVERAHALELDMGL